MKRDFLWYKSPAEVWTDALPLGNGKLGAMVYGQTLNEMIQIDESTFWSGEASIDKNNRTDTKEVLNTLRKMLSENKIEEADKLGHQFIGIKNNYGTNLPTGHLLIDLINVDLIPVDKDMEVKNYQRSLDFESSIAKTTFEINNTRFIREVFVSNPHQVLALIFTSEEKKKFDLNIRYDGIENDVCIISEEYIAGNAYETLHSDGTKGVHLEGFIRIVTDGIKRFNDGTIFLSDATYLNLFIDLETNMFEKNPKELCTNRVNKAVEAGYEAVKECHIKDFSDLYNRVDFWLDGVDYSHLPTDIRLDNMAAAASHICGKINAINEDVINNIGNINTVNDAVNNVESTLDLGLISLLFHYGRYLFIASSRENAPLPTHMGGIWNDNKYNKQDSTQDMHIDLNIQMQYWIASAIRMNEGCMPLFRWIKDTLVPSGRIAAKEEYGAKGWVSHVVSNPWGFSSLGWSYNWGAWALGGVWAALEMWSYYSYTRDINFLNEMAYPVLKEAAEFCLDYLFEVDGCEYLMAGPSYSPENMFTYEGKGYFLALSNTCDILLIRELFIDVLKCAEELHEKEDDILKKIKEALQKLAPYKIGHWGNLREWFMDFEEHIPGHRHTSHLLGIYPYWQIEADRDEELVKAVRVSLEGRLKKWEFTSWGIALFIGTYARIYDGDAAIERLMVNFMTQMRTNMFPIMGAVTDFWRGAWELDGNTGITAAMCELFVQSHDDKIYLLPALPSIFKDGYLSRIALYGGNLINIKWKDGCLIEAVLFANVSGDYNVHYNGKTASLKINKGDFYHLEKIFLY